jgi:hypothetical protein
MVNPKRIQSQFDTMTSSLEYKVHKILTMLTNMAITVNDLKFHYDVKRTEDTEEMRTRAID